MKGRQMKSTAKTLTLLMLVTFLSTSVLGAEEVDYKSTSYIRLSDYFETLAKETAGAGYVICLEEDGKIEIIAKGLTKAQIAGGVAATNNLFVDKIDGLLIVRPLKHKMKTNPSLGKELSAKTITMIERKIHVKGLLKKLAQQVGINIVVGAKVKGTVSIKVTKAPVPTIINTICRSFGLVIAKFGDLYCVARRSDSTDRSLRKNYDITQQKLSGAAGTITVAQVEKINKDMLALRDELDNIVKEMSKPADRPAPRRSRGRGRGHGGWNSSDVDAELHNMHLTHDMQFTAKKAEECRQRGLKIVNELKKLNVAYTALQRGEHLGSKALRDFYLKGETPKEQMEELKKKMDAQRAKFSDISEQYKKLKVKADKARKDFKSWRSSYRR